MIEILPETRSDMLVIQASKKLTANDYEHILIPALETILTAHGKIKGVIYISEDFQGWELKAIWDDAKFGIQHRKDFDKLAIVGGKSWIEWITKMGALLTSAEIKFYEEAQLINAISWVKN